MIKVQQVNRFLFQILKSPQFTEEYRARMQNTLELNNSGEWEGRNSLIVYNYDVSKRLRMVKRWYLKLHFQERTN